MEDQHKNNSTVSQVASVVNLPGYEIKDVLGKGGMAVVYLAIQQSIGREVALKILVPDHTDDSFTERFLHEARVISNLNHPNIITVYDAGVHQGCHYMSMEYVPGNSLREARDKLSRKQKIKVIKQIAQALDYAGKKGYVHRDIKPENILLHEDGRAILTDFGIARNQHATQGLTMTGKVIGTPYYMSPEQAKGIPVDHRSDIYSLGVVLFQALTGHLPYDGPSLVAIGIKHISDPIPELPTGQERFQAIINTSLSKDPNHRYQTAEEFFQALDAIPESELDFLEAKANAMRTTTQKAAVDYSAKTMATDSVSNQPAAKPASASPMPSSTAKPSVKKPPSAPTIQPDQIRSAHTHDSLPGKKKKNHALMEPDEVDDFYITGNADFQQLNRRKRFFIWFLILGLLAAGGYYRQDDVLHVWNKYLQPAFENAKQEFAKQTGSQTPATTADQTTKPEALAKNSDVAESGSDIASDDASLDEPVDINTPLAEQPENIKQLARTYTKLLKSKADAPRARAGLTEIANWYVSHTRSAMQEQNTSKAREFINEAKLSLPKEFRPTELAILEQDISRQEGINAHLQKADGYLKQGALIVPAGSNALDELQAVLKIDPEHGRAKELIHGIANDYYQKALQQLKADKPSEALQSTELGLSAESQHAKLLAHRSLVKKEIEVQNQIRELLAQAGTQFKAGQIIEPKGQSAVDLYRTVLAKKEQHPDALKGLRASEDYVVKQINTAIWENRLGLAEKYLQKALVYFPNSSQLDQASRKLQISRAKNAPRVTHILISQYPMSSLLKEQEVLQTTPTIYVGFSYTNLPKNTTILDFKLDSVNERLNLINKKLLVSEQNGEHIFSVKHPLATFLPGQYRITIQLDKQNLLLHEFAISNQAPEKIKLP